jgi:hypothetical protein
MTHTRTAPGFLWLLSAALVLFAVVLPALAEREPGPLRVALVSHGACADDESLPRLRALLSERGLQGSIVGEDTLVVEIDAFDVVVVGAGPFLCEWSWRALEETVAPWVRRGGGLVSTGWVPYYLADNPRGERYAGFERVLPVTPGTAYHTEPVVWPISGHPITEGLQSSFVADYDNHGGGVREGAARLLRVGDTFTGAAWDIGDGRAVHLGPNYLGAWTYYQNRRLLDGTQPDSVRLLMQAVEWAGRQR